MAEEAETVTLVEQTGISQGGSSHFSAEDMQYELAPCVLRSPSVTACCMPTAGASRQPEGD